MVGKATKSSIPASTSANKDLSCLRCRKKKAKCSKTRPTCTRCSRSNQPCEYPDAPPNLTDLSQKVLTLYDTLRELEGEFLVKYMQTMDEDSETVEEVDGDLATTTIDDTAYHNALDEVADTIEKKGEEEPAGWSMSLTPNGLSIQAVTRNLGEFNEFAKLISRQIIRDFGSDYLPRLWDPDAEGYFKEDSDAEELDEDEYLVTVPVFSTRSLLFNGENPTTRIKAEEVMEKDVMRTLLNGKDTLVSLIQSHYPHMLEHLGSRYKSLEEEEEETIQAPHHLVILMFQLRSYLPSLDKLRHDDPLSQIYILTAYVVSVTLLPTLKDLPPLPMSLWSNCAEYATMLVVDVILSQGDTIPTYPVLLCCVLLSWIDVIQDNKADAMVHMSLRLLCGSHWQGQQEPAWQMLIATLLYLDTYSATFRFKRPQLRGEDVNKLWKAANQMREPAKWNNDRSIREAGIVLESRLMYLLNKVVSLFYQVEKSVEANVRKIDVDEVFALVREIELWEQELPDWARWKSDKDTNAKRLYLKMHMHMIHNMVKILLFRPFCCSTAKTGIKEEEEGEDYGDIEQTFTKTTFLDMSISSADRLTSCLCSLGKTKKDEDDWTRAAINLVKDVSARVLKMFDKDEEVVNGLEKILNRLL